MFGTHESILTALRFVCRDDDGMLYTPISDGHKRPLVYIPGHSIHAEGEEIHQILIWPFSGDIEVLAGNGYTISEGRLIDVIRDALTR